MRLGCSEGRKEGRSSQWGAVRVDDQHHCVRQPTGRRSYLEGHVVPWRVMSSLETAPATGLCSVLYYVVPGPHSTHRVPECLRSPLVLPPEIHRHVCSAVLCRACWGCGAPLCAACSDDCGVQLPSPRLRHLRCPQSPLRRLVRQGSFSSFILGVLTAGGWRVRWLACSPWA